MAKVHVCNVVVLDNPSHFNNPFQVEIIWYWLVAASKTFSFQFEITFECIEDLPEDLEWKIIYVGSAESEEFDQVLDTVYVGPVPEGRHMFVFQVTLSKYWLSYITTFPNLLFSPRPTPLTLRRSPRRTWWGWPWCCSHAATDPQVSYHVTCEKYYWIV